MHIFVRNTCGLQIKQTHLPCQMDREWADSYPHVNYRMPNPDPSAPQDRVPRMPEEEFSRNLAQGIAAVAYASSTPTPYQERDARRKELEMLIASQYALTDVKHFCIIRTYSVLMWVDNVWKFATQILYYDTDKFVQYKRGYRKHVLHVIQLDTNTGFISSY